MTTFDSIKRAEWPQPQPKGPAGFAPADFGAKYGPSMTARHLNTGVSR